jgi:hypothetical protein
VKTEPAVETWMPSQPPADGEALDEVKTMGRAAVASARTFPVTRSDAPSSNLTVVPGAMVSVALTVRSPVTW